MRRKRGLEAYCGRSRGLVLSVQWCVSPLPPLPHADGARLALSEDPSAAPKMLSELKDNNHQDQNHHSRAHPQARSRGCLIATEISCAGVGYEFRQI